MTLLSDAVGRVLGQRYRLVSPLGVGGSAHVYLAEDTVLRRQVAVKVLQPALVGDERFLKRFRAEARAAASLNHPNIMRVLDWGEDPDGPYLVLEYLSGGTLRELLDRGMRLDPAQAAQLGQGAAAGLAYAHDRGIVHRDIKPANLIFDEDGVIRVADFGVARALAEAAWTEPAGAMVGTIPYASPEQALGEAVEGRSDVYALALVVFESLTGRVPFAEDTSVATLMARVGASLPEDPALGPLGSFLRLAAAPEIADRPDARAMAAGFQSVASALPSARPLPIIPTPAGLRPTAPADHTAFGVAAPPAGASSDLTALGVAAPEALPVGHARPAVDDRPTSAATTAGVTMAGVAPTRAPRHAAPEPVLTRAAPPAMAPPPPAIAHRRRRRWPWVAAVVVIAVAVGGFFAMREKVFVPSHLVPALAGASLSSAHAQLGTLHLTMHVDAGVHSTTVPAGAVVSQDPAAHTSVKEGTAVSVVPSLGLPNVTVPSLKGLDCTAAQRVLSVANLTGTCPSSAAEYTSKVQSGLVITWSLGSTVEPTTAPWHSTIVIATSKGPQPVTVLQVAGQSYDAAAAALRGAGLQPEEAPGQSSTTVPAGQVIDTQPAAGQSIPTGSTVTVFVSTGPPSVTIPSSLIGETKAVATGALEALGLRVGKVTGNANGVVTSTDPAPGQPATAGSSVNLHLAVKPGSKGSTGSSILHDIGLGG